MCTTCGCSDGAAPLLTNLASGRVQSIGERLERPGAARAIASRSAVPEKAPSAACETLALERDLLARNDEIARRNRDWLQRRAILALNLLSSPGAGKTRLLERTMVDLRGEMPLGVVEGDQETLFDAERIRATGCPSVQLNTGTGCHLEAEMIAGALEQLAPAEGALVMIENVGNLVCPALFDLGEDGKVVILSVTEGEDKPLKYPHMFRAASLMILNKIDLLPHVEFDAEACIRFARQVNPQLEVLRLSAATGEGMEGWYRWLRERRQVGGAGP